MKNIKHVHTCKRDVSGVVRMWEGLCVYECVRVYVRDCESMSESAHGPFFAVLPKSFLCVPIKCSYEM